MLIIRCLNGWFEGSDQEKQRPGREEEPGEKPGETEGGDQGEQGDWPEDVQAGPTWAVQEGETGGPGEAEE